ncbi:MAG TPA: hypothetical protein VFH11_00615 [Gemmatimonadota bacterium]|nr:hypothetical protein [Gemmatimonadota bacterium]
MKIPMTRIMHPVCLAAIAIVSGTSCERGPVEDRDGAAADSIATPDVQAFTDGLSVWRGDGFTMLVPAAADIVPIDPQPPATWAVIVAGPGFVREVEGRVLPGPPAYRLDAATYTKPDTVELEDWVAARLSEREETGSEPASEPGIVVAVAGEPALRTGSAPGLAGTASYWLERNGKVVELRLEEEPESPLSGIQRHIQSLILSTFEWSGLVAEATEAAATR